MKDQALMDDIEKMIGEYRFNIFTSNYEIAGMINNYYKLMVRPYREKYDNGRI